MNLYHYCPNPAFLSIISNREIWVSDFSLSNDAMEGKWVREIFAALCKEKKLLPSDETQLLQHFDGLLAIFGGAGFCMSEEGDLLSQWRAYADNGGGISIGFNEDYFGQLSDLLLQRNGDFGISIQKVNYDVAEQQKIVSTTAAKIFDLVSQGALRLPSLLTIDPDAAMRDREKLLNELLGEILEFFPHLYTLKNPAFREEREWRLISYVSKRIGTGKSLQLSKLDFRSSGDRIVPYAKIPLDQMKEPSIVEIVVGPRNITPDEVFRAALQKFGWENVKVRRSSASYRQ